MQINLKVVNFLRKSYWATNGIVILIAFMLILVYIDVSFGGDGFTVI